MSIEIRTYVKLNDKPRFSPSQSSTSRKGVFYSDTLEIKYTDLKERVNDDGSISDIEHNYLVMVKGSATTNGVLSPDILALSSFLRAYDFKKTPLQLECKMFKVGSRWASEVKQFVSDRDTDVADCILDAKELLAKLKK